MSKTITYYYPDNNNPSSLKVFQDRSSQIRGFAFERDYTKYLTKEEYSTNYAIYFLFDKSNDLSGKRLVYIGQSKRGIDRVVNHTSKKKFWTHAVMFVSDGNVFDANAIDYMEYYFINLFQNLEHYELVNSDLRAIEPNLNFFDKITYRTYLKQIEFLLKAEGVKFQEMVEEEELDDKVDEVVEELFAEDNSVDQENVEFQEFYYPVSDRYNAKLYEKKGMYFISKGSIINFPKETMKDYSDNGAAYERINNLVLDLIENGKIKVIDNYTGEVVVDIENKTTSGAACLISGASMNGWSFFKNISERR